MRDIPKLFNDELDKLTQEATILLFTIDATMIGGGYHRFYSGLNEKREPLIFQGKMYDAFPTTIDGIQFGTESNGYPTFVCSNITGLMTGLIVQYQDLVGAYLYLTAVNVKFIDAVNFKNGNPHADPNQETQMVYKFNKLNQINNSSASFELCMPDDAPNAMIPKHNITVNNCIWKYRGDGCPYTGTNYFNYKDEPVTSKDDDACSKLESGCIVRFGEDAVLPIGAFLAADKISG